MTAAIEMSTPDARFRFRGRSESSHSGYWKDTYQVLSATGDELFTRNDRGERVPVTESMLVPKRIGKTARDLRNRTRRVDKKA